MVNARIAAGIAGLFFGLAALAAVAAPENEDWAGTWATAVAPPALFDAPLPEFNDQTLRQIVRISVGGRQVRIRLSNVHGTAPLRIEAATVAKRADGAAVRPASLRALTFGGHSSVVVAAGARVLSDPVRLSVQNFADLAISLYIGDGAVAADSPVSHHARALQTSYVLSGNQVDAVNPTVDATTDIWFYLSGVDVLVGGAAPVIAMLGDSITDGDESTPDANKRWPNLLAERLLADRPVAGRGPGVLNVGISGNQVTTTLIGDGLQARLDRDVLAQTRVSHVIVLAGINDLGLPGLLTVIGIPTPTVSAEQVISGLQQVAVRARAAGLKAIGATITPSGSSPLPGYSGADLEARRQTVNAWIRSRGAFDAVIDFDRVLRDPDDPTRMRDELSADGLHPNDNGYQAMADSIRLGIFRD